MTAFEPKHMGDSRTRFDALWIRVAESPTPTEKLRTAVLDLITQSTNLLQFDAIGKGFVMQAVNFLNQGNLRQCLANMKFALDSYQPS